jgi:hypothetical protein
MKFFIVITLISSFLTAHWVFPDDAQDTLAPSGLLYCLYSIRHNLWPKNAVPNISSSTLEIPFEDGAMYDLLISSPKHSFSMMVDIQHGCGHDLYSPLLSISERSPNYIVGLSDPDIFAEYLLSEHGIDTWLPKLYGHSFGLRYVNSCDIHSSRKSKKFIETKVTAINCRVLTFS